MKRNAAIASPDANDAERSVSSRRFAEEGVAARLAGVSLRYGKTLALDGVDLSVPAGAMVGLIGPDGVGKSSLLSLVAGAHAVQTGTVEVLGGDIADARHRDRACPRIAYMPQGLGKNLYPTLSVEENLQFFARLFGHGAAERRRRIDRLTKSTGLYPFLDRAAGKLSGGMKQKLGLCCSLIHDPDLLILDEPTTGVDPLARSQFWDLIDEVRGERDGMAVMVATAYMDEAQRFGYLVAMDEGKVLDTGTPAELLEKTGKDSLDAAFIELLPPEKRAGHKEIVIGPLETHDDDIAIEAKGLTRRFGKFTAVDHVSFRIRRGEIFGFLGSNGCGKTTTMKMLTGLLPASDGEAWLFGQPAGSGGAEARKRLGYMTQAFSLYGELTVRQNLVLHARLYQIPEDKVSERVDAMLKRFGLEHDADRFPDNLPLGIRQRLSLAAAVVHDPDILILDEPTSGVDPVARDGFWELIVELSRRDHVTIFITTHFMNEAERCDRISLMHAGKSLACDRPAALVKERGAKSLEDAFIGYLLEAGAGVDPENGGGVVAPDAAQSGRFTASKKHRPPHAGFSPLRLYSCCWRESLELMRDPIRATLALAGSMILMLVMGYGITMDVEDLRYAVLDRDQSGLSRNYLLNLSGSRYFVEQPPLGSYEDMDRRLRANDIALAVEIPPDFGRDFQRDGPVEVAVWVDGAMPMRAETIQGYVQAMHQGWLDDQNLYRFGKDAASLATVETRYRYNPDVKSLPAMVPAVIPILLLMLPAVLAALAVVREKEMGSIINMYTTPLTRVEFMLGKQMPYVLLSMVSFVLMTVMAVLLFEVPIKGSVWALGLAAFLYCGAATGMGLLASCVTRSQIAVMFLTLIATMLPATQFCGLINPVTTLGGFGRVVGELYPTTHFLTVSRGVFNKALGLADLYQPMFMILLSIPVIVGLAIALLKPQET